MANTSHFEQPYLLIMLGILQSMIEKREVQASDMLSILAESVNKYGDSEAPILEILDTMVKQGLLLHPQTGTQKKYFILTDEGERFYRNNEAVLISADDAPPADLLGKVRDYLQTLPEFNEAACAQIMEIMFGNGSQPLSDWDINVYTHLDTAHPGLRGQFGMIMEGLERAVGQAVPGNNPREEKQSFLDIVLRQERPSLHEDIETFFKENESLNNRDNRQELMGLIEETIHKYVYNRSVSGKRNPSQAEYRSETNFREALRKELSSILEDTKNHELITGLVEIAQAHRSDINRARF